MFPQLSSTNYWTKYSSYFAQTMCNGPDNMFGNHNLEAKISQTQARKSHENLRKGIFAIVSVWRDLTDSKQQSSTHFVQE